MFYNSMHVHKPENSVVYPKNNYVYFTAEKIYIKEKKHNQNKRVLIGKMIDDNLMIPNDNARTYFPEWFDTVMPPVLSDTLSIGNSIIIEKVLYDLQMSQLLDSIFDDHSNLIKDLIQYMIIEESTTIQHFPSLMRRVYIFSEKIYSDTSIGRFLKENVSYQKRELFLNSWNDIYKAEAIYISYDSSNINTYSEGVEIAEFGYAKEMDDVPMVNLSYAINQLNGRPLFYELYPGSIVDNSQLTYMIDKAKEYGYEDIGIILDRGYFSKKNIQYIEEAGYDLIMMVKTNQKVIKELIEQYRVMIADKMESYIGAYGVYGKTIKKKLYKDNEKEYYVHIYYDVERANGQRMSLLNTYIKMEKDLEKRVSTKKQNKEEDVKRFKKGFTMNFDADGNLVKYDKIKEKIQKELDKMGYFVIVTSKEMSAGEALEIYRDRDTVEKLFRSLKSELDYNRFRVHGDASLEAKTFITFLANIVRNEIYVKTKKLKVKSKKNYTVPSIINEMSKVEVTRNSRNEYIRRYGLTKRQKDILEQFEIDDKKVGVYVNQINNKQM